MSEGFDGFIDPSIDHDRVPVRKRRAQARSPKLLPTTSAPLMRSISRGSRSSDAASDHVRPSSHAVGEHSQLISPPTILLDPSGAPPININQSSPSSVTSHPPLDHPSSTGQRRVSTPNATSPLLNSAVADISQAIRSEVANCFNAGTLDEARIQTIVQARLLSLLSSQASTQSLPRSQSSNRSATRGEQLSCNECHKSVARRCDMKYVHFRG